MTRRRAGAALLAAALTALCAAPASARWFGSTMRVFQWNFKRR